MMTIPTGQSRLKLVNTKEIVLGNPKKPQVQLSSPVWRNTVLVTKVRTHVSSHQGVSVYGTVSQNLASYMSLAKKICRLSTPSREESNQLSTADPVTSTT
jgi:hypothetical protein